MADDFTTFILDTKWKSFPWVWKVILIIRGRRKLYCDHELFKKEWTDHKRGKRGFCRANKFSCQLCPKCGYKSNKKLICTGEWHSIFSCPSVYYVRIQN